MGSGGADGSASSGAESVTMWSGSEWLGEGGCERP